jgi:conjugative relaxase-like TrwC/TraI family protein
MLSIGVLGAGGSYHQYLAGSYYAGEESGGDWHGTGAKLLGLSKKVTEKQFNRLFQGYGKDGEKLVQNAGKLPDPETNKGGHQAGWDLTFSAPKSVSVLWAVANPKTRHVIERCHQEAVRHALDYMEAMAGQTRRGKAGRIVESCGLVFALFVHGTSRENDPQLHTHCVTFNVGVSRDRKTRSLLSLPLYEHKMAAGALYREALAHSLTRELGLQLKRERVGFSVEGVPEKLSNELSKRREQIKAKLAEWGVYTPEAASDAAQTTKRKKERHPTEELFKIWKEAAAERGFTQDHAEQLRGKSRPLSPERVERLSRKAVLKAIEKHLDQTSYFTEKDIVRGAARLIRPGQLGDAAIREAVTKEVQGPKYIKLTSGRDGTRFTTEAVWKVEASLLNKAKNLQQKRDFAVSEKDLGKILEKGFPLTGQTPDDLKRNTEQRAAIQHLTKPERISLLTGHAGTGKSTVLKACREAWEKAGCEVHGVALAGKAARGLETASAINSKTIASFLTQLEPRTFKQAVWHHTKQVVKTGINEAHRTITEAMPHNKNRPRQRDLLRVYRGKQKLGPKSVVVVDEAGMVGTKQMERLISIVTKAKAKLVLVGDAGQLQPIEAGGPFRSLAQRFGSAVLSHITRQRLDKADPSPEWRREAVKSFAAGRVAEGLKPFEERGKVHTTNDPRTALVSDWVKAGGTKTPEKMLILAGTNEDVRAINNQCQRARLSAAGQKASGGVHVAGEIILSGDRVLFTKNERKLGVNNGDLGTVESVSGLPGLRQMSVKLDDGRSITVKTREYDSFRLGYAVTTHRAQGATIEQSFVLLGGGMQDRHLSYVQASRAREEMSFYIDRKDAATIQRQMERDRTKDMAHDHRERGPQEQSFNR